jgi:hypothetical protein
MPPTLKGGSILMLTSEIWCKGRVLMPPTLKGGSILMLLLKRRCKISPLL